MGILHCAEILGDISQDYPAFLAPSEIDNAWDLGFRLGRISEISEPPSGFDQAEADAYRAGWHEGTANRPDDDGDPFPDDYRPDLDWDTSEAVAAIGHLAYQMEGGRR